MCPRGQSALEDRGVTAKAGRSEGRGPASRQDERLIGKLGWKGCYCPFWGKRVCLSLGIGHLGCLSFAALRPCPALACSHFPACPFSPTAVRWPWEFASLCWIPCVCDPLPRSCPATPRAKTGMETDMRSMLESSLSSCLVFSFSRHRLF